MVPWGVHHQSLVDTERRNHWPFIMKCSAIYWEQYIHYKIWCRGPPIYRAVENDVIRVRQDSLEQGTPVQSPLWWIHPEGNIHWRVSWIHSTQHALNPILKNNATVHDPTGLWTLLTNLQYGSRSSNTLYTTNEPNNCLKSQMLGWPPRSLQQLPSSRQTHRKNRCIFVVDSFPTSDGIALV